MADMTHRKYAIRVVVLAAALLFSGMSSAERARAATPAGTTINNTASVAYQLNGVPYTVSATSSFPVDRIVNMTVTKLADASVTAGQSNAALSFLVSNTSNTAMRFGLSFVSKSTNTAATASLALRHRRALAAAWTMNNVRIYRDNNSNGLWDTADTLYADASTFGDVASGASLTVMIVGDGPAVLSGTQPSSYDLVATAVDAGTLNIVVQTTGANTTGVDTLYADAAGSAPGDMIRDGKHSAYASFTPVPAVLSLTKTVTVQDQWGGTQPMPGATLHYTITAVVTGTGKAGNTTFSDPVPENTTYLANTLKLNGSLLTDTLDSDVGDVGGTTLNTVTVKLGTLTNASATQTITFDVRIK